MRPMLAVLLLLAATVAACAERPRGTSGAYIGGGAGGNIARDR